MIQREMDLIENQNIIQNYIYDDVPEEDDMTRMVQRFQDQVCQKMSLEKRARKLTIMKALARNSFKMQNKENENPLNNNLALPIHFTHSTPLKSQQNNEAAMETTDGSEKKPFEIEPEEEPKREAGEDVAEENSAVAEPELVIARIYDLDSNLDETLIQEDYESDMKIEDFEIEVTPSKMRGNHLNVLCDEHKRWKSQEFLDESAEYEFCKTLEQSKLHLSSSNLLEEIEADLPSSYSLVRPLNHTFHTITSYRTLIRLNRMDGNNTNSDNLDFELSFKNEMPLKKLSYLEMEATVQKSMVEQTEKALALSRSQKSMETEHLEKTLLLAELRYNAAQLEIERLRILGDSSEENYGQITISDATFKVDKTKGSENDLFICTATNRENVQFTAMANDPLNPTLHFQKAIKFQNLNKDFIISVELYKKESKEGKIPMKTSIMKKLKELTTINGSKSLTNISSASNHGFVCLARGELRLEQIRRCKNNVFTIKFSEPPQYPVVGPTVSLVVKTDVNLADFKLSGFLNVFKNTWQRRWFFQSGHFLEAWLYPDDQENDKPPIDSIYLGNVSASVEAADIEVCVRSHSFFVKFGSNEKLLFSADSHQDMIKWMDHLTAIFNQVRLWNQK